MKKQSLLFFIFVFLLLSGQNSHAEEKILKQENKPVRIEYMVISATKTAHPLSEAPLSISIINAQQLKQSASPTVGDLFRDIPGIEILDTGALAGQKRIMIRGESGSRVLVLIDGQKISEQKSMDGAALLIDINSIERIEVIKGPASVLYGSEGMGGVINVITKKEGNKPVQFELSSIFNTNTDGWNNYASIYGGGEDLGGFGYRVSVSNSHHGNQRGADSEAIDHTNYHNNEVTGRLSYTFRNIDAGISFSSYNSDTNAFLWEAQPYDFAVPPAEWSPGNNVGEEYRRFNNMEIPEWNRDKEALFVQWNKISDTLFKIRIDAFKQDTFKHFITEPFVAPRGWYPDNSSWMNTGRNQYSFINFEVDTKNDMDSENASIQMDWFFFDSHYVIMGSEFYTDDLDALNSTTYRPGSLMSMFSYGQKKEWITADRESRDVYLQDEWNIANGWLATFGFRYSEAESNLKHNRIIHEHEFDPILYPLFTSGRNDVEEINREPGSSTDYSSNYSFSLLNTSIDNLSLRIHYGTAYTLPTLSQFFVWSSHSGTITAPNPDLEPETAESYEIGARYKTDQWDIDLTLYTTRAEEYITDVAIDHIEGAGKQYQNINEAKTRGIELAASYTFLSWQATPYIMGNYIEREFAYSAMSTKDTGMPELQGRFGLRYEHEFNKLNLFWADLFGRVAKNALEVDGNGEIVSKTPGWGTANFVFGMQLDGLFSMESKVNITAGVNNIFDKEYIKAQQENIESPGRHFTFKAAMDF